MGTKGNQKNSNRSLIIIITVFLIALIGSVIYGLYQLHKIDSKVDAQNAKIKNQEEQIESQGSLLDQKELELNQSIHQTEMLSKTYSNEINSYQEQMKEKDSVIQKLRAETKRQKELLSDEKKEASVKTGSVSAASQMSNKPSEDKSETKSGKVLKVRATAYTAYCQGCSGTTATGIDLRANPNQKVIAVDPNVIPLGSRVHVEGYGEAIAGDTGGAIKGNRIDVFIPSTEKAYEFGVRQVNVTLLSS